MMNKTMNLDISAIPSNNSFSKIDIDTLENVGHNAWFVEFNRMHRL